MVVVRWSAPNHTPIKYTRCMLKNMWLNNTGIPYVTLEPDVLVEGCLSIQHLPFDTDYFLGQLSGSWVLWIHYVVENLPINHSSKQHACERIFERVGGDIPLNKAHFAQNA